MEEKKVRAKEDPLKVYERQKKYKTTIEKIELVPLTKPTKEAYNGHKKRLGLTHEEMIKLFISLLEK